MKAFLRELCTRRLWVEVFAEFLITTLFISFVCGCSLSWSPPSSVMHMAISSGLGVATFAFTMWDVSSGLFNPALTIAYWVGRKKSFAQTLFYIIAQISGSICGAAFIYGVAPDKAIQDSNLAVNLRNPDVSVGQALGVEIWITFILVLVVFAVVDPDRKLSGYGPPLAIGFYVFVGLNFSIPISGGGMNPARSFGPAVIMNSWQDHWVSINHVIFSTQGAHVFLGLAVMDGGIYWVGPIIGAIVASLLYHYLFAQRMLRLLPSSDDVVQQPEISLPIRVITYDQAVEKENSGADPGFSSALEVA